MMRECGDCQLCCKLVPVPEIGKLAGQRCKNQRFRKGCALYHTPFKPITSNTWNCRWLVNDDTADLPRPDRSHYVIDINPDYLTLTNGVTVSFDNQWHEVTDGLHEEHSRGDVMTVLAEIQQKRDES
jgi:hypothetical protein